MKVLAWVLRKNRGSLFFISLSVMMPFFMLSSMVILKENMKGHRRIAASSLCNIFSANFGYLLLLFIGNSMIGEGIKDFAMLSKVTQYRGEMMRNQRNDR